jgi:proteasome lid subunit RPN8/RPN11
MSDDALVTVQVYPFRSDAELARARLDAAGIRSVVRADDEGGLNPGFFARYGVRLEVRSDEAAAARTLLADENGAAAWLFPAEMTAAMVAQARFTYPEEACGLIAVDTEGVPQMVYCLTNVTRSRYRFTVDPNEHYRAWRHAERNGWEIGGVFHSHPESAAYPSSTDIAGALDPEWLYVIVGLSNPEDPEIRVFSIAGGAVAELDDSTGSAPAHDRASG